MEEKKICKIEDEALQNVAGGKDDSKYCVGLEVDFKAMLYGWEGAVEKELVGTIIEVNGNMYKIKTRHSVYDVKEEDIFNIRVSKVDKGAYGGWN